MLRSIGIATQPDCVQETTGTTVWVPSLFTRTAVAAANPSELSVNNPGAKRSYREGVRFTDERNAVVFDADGSKRLDDAGWQNVIDLGGGDVEQRSELVRAVTAAHVQLDASKMSRRGPAASSREWWRRGLFQRR